MPKVQTADNRLLDVAHQGNTLVVRKLSAPYQTRLTVVAFLFLLACVLFAIALTASREEPQFRWVLVILGIAVVVMTVRMFDITNYSAKEDSFRFDTDNDSIQKNGQELATTNEVDHVLVRRIRREDDEDIETSDYALVIAMQSTKRFTITESEGVPGARTQIMRAAEEVAEYLQVPVKEGERLPTEYWMDR